MKRTIYKGGILQFQDGDPSSIVPVAGVSKYTFTLIHVQNNFLMKDTYLLLGNYVKFYEKFFSRMLSSTLLITVMSIV